ncbi:hypothetical protein L1887_16891 [Cichorium endivia]|nr:hypothetical protein L1887_16891 [Cichorium endivia]
MRVIDEGILTTYPTSISPLSSPPLNKSKVKAKKRTQPPFSLSLSTFSDLSLALSFPVYSHRTSLGNLTIPYLLTRFCLFSPFSSSYSLLQTSNFRCCSFVAFLNCCSSIYQMLHLDN